MEKDSNERSDEQSKQQFFSMHDLEEELRLLDQQPSFGFLAKDAVRPLLTVENAKKSGETLRPLNCLSLIYLLVNNVTNAWNYCKRIENGNFPLPEEFEKIGPYILSNFVGVVRDMVTADKSKKARLLEWQDRILCALHATDRYAALSKLQPDFPQHREALQVIFQQKEMLYLDSIRYSLFLFYKNLPREDLTRLEQKLNRKNLTLTTLLELEHRLGSREELLRKIVKLGFDPPPETPMVKLLWRDASQIPDSVSNDNEPDTKRLKKGRCLIINQEVFSKDVSQERQLDDRHGSKHDREMLKKTWENFGCHVDIKENLSNKDMVVKAVKDFSDSLSVEQYDYSVVCILSHGGVCPIKKEDEIYASNGEGVPTSELIQIVQRAPGTAGRPKLFIFQACRGQIDQPLLSVVSLPAHLKRECAKTIRTAYPESYGKLILHSSTRGYSSYRGSTGSPVIQTFCHYMNLYGDKTEFKVVLDKMSVSLQNAMSLFLPEYTVAPGCLMYFTKC